ncbi:metal-dependent transcriptional regulator [Corynebacterium lizhenjunii]|uniref:Diphtheria toxin repressor n=1 Tax=Corynebacterium lizhenjunii TaxID=2709394 RepID=A0A7T0PC86_9CORY|nr:metal-dependent transcriptional regulator [Corynebacterium lizhenjunii]QPK79437.1 metal-dependent transcriptional regulator [Corynebacterium lizhenjunii]
MHLNDLPERSQEYLKALWDLVEHHGETVTVKDLVARTGQKPPTASEAIKRLAAQGLVEHERYAGVSLTAAGRELAMEIVRRHRLLETFLVTNLGYSWDEVHEDADILEHACSDRFIDRLDALLGHPDRDPHGDPIPDAHGRIADLGTDTLADAPVGQPLTLLRVCDTNSDLLRYLGQHGVQPGDELTIRADVAGLLEIDVRGDVISLAKAAAHDVTVAPA